jgi:hypothetical protein
MMVSATEILVSGVFWPRKNTEFHGIIEKQVFPYSSVFFPGSFLSLPKLIPAEGVIKVLIC